VHEIYDAWTTDGPLGAARWVHPFPLDPGAHRMAAVRARQLHLHDVPMSSTSDDVHDAHKYFAMSTRRWAIPAHGQITVTADVRALTPGVQPGRVLPTTGRVLLDGQQAAATLHLTDLGGTGVVFDWFVGERTAFALYERLMLPGVTQATAYTQIVQELTLPPSALPDGRHRYAIRFVRAPGALDRVEWLLDGSMVMSVDHIGIPLDRQPDAPALPVTYASLGPGELLGARVQALEVGIGIFSLLGEFPFNQVPGREVSIPREQRLFGQGVDATFGPLVVTTEAA
jgi:hypothetical protein